MKTAIANLMKKEIKAKRTVRISLMKTFNDALAKANDEASKKAKRVLSADIRRCESEGVPPRLSQLVKAFQILSQANVKSKRKSVARNTQVAA